jgi:cytochrome c oxidase subunit 3
MSFLRHLTEKPWEAMGEEDLREDRPYGASPLVPVAGPVALNFFIAVVSILFLLLLMAYAARMTLEDWRPAPQPGLLWQNTIFLILASIAMEWARHSATQGRLDGVKLGMFGGGVFTAAFIAGQILAWRQLSNAAFADITNPAVAFFYLITGLHVCHLLGGLVAWGWVLDRLWRSAGTEAIRESVRLCARYWHFLLIVWLVLFGLLFSGNNSLNFLLTICGFR